ncbi:2-keto-4-pentenoate hydratase [Mesonia algae]|uniref:2-keto-4-pentenoate hydratase n=1 Tax=Mesonia algae TaxID=213248 RepID=A0A2W7HVW8_9FLAO|nr:fumarylacetoacetate hydrolase family protein [Mesonia algae]PZW38644.1 2-keto-4-pentenoate hydratase [Mesonia algae]
MTHQEIAAILLQAEITQKACDPIRSHLKELDLESAYKIQKINVDQKIAKGGIEIGKKIGLTSFKVQEQLGVDQPDFGVLLQHMQFQQGENLAFAELMQPKAEAEIAFILKEDLKGKNITIEDVILATDYITSAIEIVGSRIKDWNIKITDTIADNASSSHFILGTKKANVQEIDLENNKMQLFVNDQLVSEGDGTSCMGNPLNSVVWLANKMNDLGNPLKKGEIILSGALGPMVNLNPSDKVKASIEGLGNIDFLVD